MLTALAQGLTVSKACEEAGWPRRTFYDVKDREPGFAAEVEYATQTAKEDLLGEAEAMLKQRALDVEDSKSHTLLVVLLKRLDPEYREGHKTERTVRHEKVTEISFDQSEIDKAVEILTSAKTPSSEEESD